MIKIIRVLFIFIVTGCGVDLQQKFKKEYYPSGELKSAGWYIKDSILVDSIHYYYKNGNIEQIELRDSLGMLQGVSKFFYENGELFQSVPYINNLKEGFVYEYSESGTLHSKILFLSGVQTGDSYWFHGNNTIEQYSFLDFSGRNRNLIRWDSASNLKKNLGKTIFLDSTKSKRDKLGRKGFHSYDIILIVSNPPHKKSILQMSYLSKSGSVLKTDSIVAQSYKRLEQTFPDSLFQIKFLGIQYDSLTKTLSYQTSISEISY